MGKKTKADLETEVRQLKEKARFWEDIAGSHLEKIDAKDNEIEGLYKNAEKQRQELETVISEWKGQALRVQAEFEDANRERSELRSKIDELEEDNGIMATNAAIADEYIGDVNEKLKQGMQERDDLKKENQELTDLVNQTNREKLEAMDDAEKQISEWRTATEHQCKTIDQLNGLLMEKTDIIEELDAVVDNTNNELNEYMQKLNEVQNELQIKETSLQYIENGLRSAEQEVLTLRQTNRNLLNYLNIIASQDNPNIPKDFNF